MTDPTAVLAADYARLLSGLHQIADAVRDYHDFGRSNAGAHHALYEIAEILDGLRQKASAS